jgi:hypothetical protein
MQRQAADNAYLHRDFHAALNLGLRYLREHFGPEAVRDYVREFARTYHAPLRDRLMGGDLAALAEHIRHIHATEGADVEIELSADGLVVRVPFCPALRHIRLLGQEPDETFIETTRSLNEGLCEGTPFAAELLHYNPDTGASVQRFVRRTVP